MIFEPYHRFVTIDDTAYQGFFAFGLRRVYGYDCDYNKMITLNSQSINLMQLV